MKSWRMLAAVAPLLFVLVSCSQAQDAADKAKDVVSNAKDFIDDKNIVEKAQSVASTYSDPWAVGCLAVDLGLRVNHVDRANELRALDVLANSPGMPADFSNWVTQARNLLALTDPTLAPQSLKNAINGPCKAHGRPIGSLGG